MKRYLRLFRALRRWDASADSAVAGKSELVDDDIDEL
jgi:hypothetical protein